MKSKQIKEVLINYNINWYGNIEISRIRKDLDEVEKMGATHICISSSDGFDIDAYQIREETDNEANKRKIKEDEIYEMNKISAIHTINILKKRYGI